MQRRWISAKEAAQYLNLHLKTIYRLVARHAIPFTKIDGYGIRIDRIELDRLLEAEEYLPQNFSSILDGKKARK